MNEENFSSFFLFLYSLFVELAFTPLSFVLANKIESYYISNSYNVTAKSFTKIEPYGRNDSEFQQLHDLEFQFQDHGPYNTAKKFQSKDEIGLEMCVI